jgi:hypothetical protein
MVSELTFKPLNVDPVSNIGRGHPIHYPKVDELVKSHVSDGFVKSPRSRLANPEE